MTVANWLATYWIHSTLALGAAWLLERCLPHRLRVAEAAWKVALVAGLVTATLQLSFGIHPLGGRRRLPWNAPAQASAATPLRIHRPVHVAVRHAAPMPIEPARTPMGLTLFISAWALGGGLALGGLFFSWRRFQRRLADRRELADTRVRASLGGLPGGVRVRLTRSAALDVPLALGVLRREICVPDRALAELDGERIDALLAHELAHLTRRDPIWLLASSLISRALLLQPLNFLAARRIASYAELACDDLAAAWTRHPLALAHCLADVAGWLVRPRAALGAPAMAGTPSLLRRRVERLLAVQREHPESLPRWFPAAAVLVIAGALAFAPSCASWEEPARAQTPIAAPPAPPSPVQPQLAIVAEPIEPVVVARHRHHVKARPMVVQVENDDADDDDDRKACDDNDVADDDDDDADDAVSDALEDLPDQIAEAMESINEAREAISPEAMAELQRDVQEALKEARRSMPTRTELAQIEQQVQRAMAEAQQSVERARKNLPKREELERVREDVRHAIESARRAQSGHHGDLERLDQEIERSKRETERLKEERRRLRESRDE
jgi:beta-lactamase regulating signal transducer with metallopeptidase domain